MDVIDFILHKENTTKHQAINKAVEILGHNEPHKNDRYQPNLSREQFIGNMFQYFKNAISNSKPAKEYLQSRNLDYKKIEVGYNGGQFHHGVRKDETVIAQCLEYGLLIDKNILARTGEKAYGVFGKLGIVFALKNKQNQVVSLYFRSSLMAEPVEANASSKQQNAKHFYLKNRQGLYPNYPNPNTKKLILTESIIDAASLLQLSIIHSQFSILACFGTNGLNEEIQNAIKELQQLEEIIFCFDNDTAGKEAVNKYALMLQNDYPNLKLTTIELPNKDINETLQLHENEIIIELLSQRKPVFARNEAIFELATQTPKPTATTQKIKIGTRDLDEPKIPATAGVEAKIEFLKQENLLQEINKLIEQTGIIGEENARLLLCLITISYLNKNPLHGIVQGSSGSGKTHMISRIADLMPPEDVLRFTRITESSLYNWGEFDLFKKVIIIEDLDGLKEDALYALREFISNQVLRSSVTIKDKKGNNKSTSKEVKGQFSSLSATTKGETYEDNMSRSFLLAVDESQAQTQRIINYQNRRNAGEIDRNQQTKAIHLMQSVIRNLKHYEVVNPFATSLLLPDKVHKVRRLNEMYQAVIKQVTFLNQYQRKTTADNQLITQIEDIEQATEVLFESIVLKVDELDGSLRQFFERLKKYVKNDSTEFMLRDIRLDLNISKTQIFRYIQILLELEYIKQVGGYTNKGIKYKISYWDNYQKLRAEIKDFLMQQIQSLKGNL
ncbi:unnamed protein product [Rotaria socialis]|uniref:Toprim domain-containing protein n=1 Tax=Rotaria socialis TaxID=392032 RepID=A0A818B5R7_9BILA|nr:unnamed protein product [Rotaria socialis]CAF4381322.1 unnamed protein product [Rotaria socialis]